MKKIGVTVFSSALLVACLGGDEGDKGNRGGDRDSSQYRTTVEFRSATLSSVVAQQKALGAPVESEECSLMLYGGPNSNSDPNQRGECLTPLNITGYALGADLSHDDYIEAANDDPWAIGQAQIMIRGNENETEAGQFFDLKNPVQFVSGGNVTNTPDIRYEFVNVDFESMDVQFQVKDKIWTVRYIFTTYPLYADPVFDGCLNSDGIRQMMAEDSVGKFEAVANDVLLCVKSDTTACEDADFQWLDLDSNQFVSTRPTNPYRIKAANSAFCEENANERSGYSFSTASFSMNSVLTNSSGQATRVNLWAVENETPYPDWHFVSADGVSGTGNNPIASVDFDTTNIVFIDAEPILDASSAVHDWQDADKATIFQHVYLSQIYLEHRVNSDGQYYYEDPGSKAKVTIEFGEEIEWLPPEDGEQPES